MAFLGNTTTIVTPDLMITITLTAQQSLLFHPPSTSRKKSLSAKNSKTILRNLKENNIRYITFTSLLPFNRGD